jgi:hypothetical protein
MLPLTQVSPQPNAIPGGNPPADWQSAVGWGDTGFEPGTAGQQSGAQPLNHHVSLLNHHASNVFVINNPDPDPKLVLKPDPKKEKFGSTTLYSFIPRTSTKNKVFIP